MSKWICQHKGWWTLEDFGAVCLERDGWWYYKRHGYLYFRYDCAESGPHKTMKRAMNACEDERRRKHD
jgi:hypothetical protein